MTNSTNQIVQNALAATARNMTDGVEIDERDVKAGKYREYWVTREPSMNPSGWTYRAFTYKPMLVRGMELVNNSAVAANEEYGPKFYIDAFLEGDAMSYAIDGVGEIASENPSEYEQYAKVDPRGKKIAELIRAAKQFNRILRKFR